MKERLATNFDEFVDKVSEGIRKTLNTDLGQELTKNLLQMKLAENPNMTVEEWKNTKSEFMTYLFAMFVKDNKRAMTELGEHLYNELNKEESEC